MREPEKAEFRLMKCVNEVKNLHFKRGSIAAKCLQWAGGLDDNRNITALFFNVFNSDVVLFQHASQ